MPLRLAAKAGTGPSRVEVSKLYSCDEDWAEVKTPPDGRLPLQRLCNGVPLLRSARQFERCVLRGLLRATLLPLCTGPPLAVSLLVIMRRPTPACRWLAWGAVHTPITPRLGQGWA